MGCYVLPFLNRSRSAVVGEQQLGEKCSQYEGCGRYPTWSWHFLCRVWYNWIALSLLRREVSFEVLTMPTWFDLGPCYELSNYVRDSLYGKLMFYMIKVSNYCIY